MINQSENNEVVTGMIVDSRTQQPISRGIIEHATLTIAPPNLDLAKVGTLNITPAAKAVLNEALDPKDVLIRPDGMVYVDWTYYADRLNRAFGRGKWGLPPQGAPLSKKIGDKEVLVVWAHWLVIEGTTMGMAIGECSYYESNFGMSYGDACEGAKSIALARNCKIFGMTLELWDKDWIEVWKSKFAEQYPDPKKPGKMLWRKRVIDPLKEGKKQLVKDVRDWYPTVEDIFNAIKALKVEYYIEKHDEIKKKLIDLAYGKIVIEEVPEVQGIVDDANQNPPETTG